MFQYKQNRILTAKCTLDPNAIGSNPNPPTSTGESTLIRGRSLKKSLRESFRRLRKGRTIKKSTMLPNTRRTDDNNPLSPANVHLEEVIRVPVERQVEFREFKPMDDQVISMVRCLYFAKTYLNSGTFYFLLNSQNECRFNRCFLCYLFSVTDRTRSLWAGTNGGHVYVYSINGIDPPSASNSSPTIATDQTISCSMGWFTLFLFADSNHLIIVYLNFFSSSKRNSFETQGTCFKYCRSRCFESINRPRFWYTND